MIAETIRDQIDNRFYFKFLEQATRNYIMEQKYLAKWLIKIHAVTTSRSKSSPAGQLVNH